MQMSKQGPNKLLQSTALQPKKKHSKIKSLSFLKCLYKLLHIQDKLFHPQYPKFDRELGGDCSL